eukprot:jgi/Hompol1/1285/HPOL_001119-RA
MDFEMAEGLTPGEQTPWLLAFKRLSQSGAPLHQDLDQQNEHQQQHQQQHQHQQNKSRQHVGIMGMHPYGRSPSFGFTKAGDLFSTAGSYSDSPAADVYRFGSLQIGASAQTDTTRMPASTSAMSATRVTPVALAAESVSEHTRQTASLDKPSSRTSDSRTQPKSKPEPSAKPQSTSWLESIPSVSARRQTHMSRSDPRLDQPDTESHSNSEDSDRDDPNQSQQPTKVDDDSGSHVRGRKRKKTGEPLVYDDDSNPARGSEIFVESDLDHSYFKRPSSGSYSSHYLHLPYLITGYIQLLFTLFIVGIMVYIVLQFVWSVHHDLQMKAEEFSHGKSHAFFEWHIMDQ